MKITLKHIYIKVISFFLLFMTILYVPIIYADDIEPDEETSIISPDLFLDTVEASNNLQTSSLNLNARSCIVLDRLSKQVLYGKNENTQVKMASTTKIMTSIVVIENYDLNTTVEVSKKAAGTGRFKARLKGR